MKTTDLDKAVRDGVITAEQAAKLRAQNTPSIGQEENMRFLRSFSDVFIGIGLILLCLGLSAVAGLFGGGLSFLIVAAIVFAMADYFGRRKRAHFPTLILALAFLFMVRAGLAELIGGNGIIGAAITAVAMGLFYLRIRLPVCIGLIAISLIYLYLAILGSSVPELLRDHFGIFLMIAGAVIFAVALAYDSRDRDRQTRFADNAFWLHFLAAPLLIHGLALSLVTSQVEMLFGVIPSIEVGRGEAAMVLVAVIVLTLVGLAINRRAIIVSALGYAVFALIYLFNGTGLGLGGASAATLVILGAGIAVLGVGWHQARRVVLKILPRWGIFPPVTEFGSEKTVTRA